MPPPAASLHRRIAIDTPEHVRIHYVLADLGSRAAAFAVDVAIVLGATLVVGLVMRYAGMLGAVVEMIGVTAGIIASFLLTWCYFGLFEGITGGRTPGKRALGLRVVHVGGEPLSFRGAVLRNLLRYVDLQPLPSALAGTVCILLNRRAQRLGDLVAGTIVVRDTGGGESLGTEEPPPARTGRPVLSPAQFELLAAYIARRDGLDHSVRARVAATVLEPLREVVADIARSPDETIRSDDDILVQLHEAEAPRHAARRGGASLQAATMARERREAWARYAELVERGARRGLASLTEEEVRAFGRLYRGVTADLARARTYGASAGLLDRVQRWAGAGHNLLYRKRGRTAVSLGRWVAAGFPRAFRAHIKPILLAMVLFYGSGWVTFAAVRADPVMGRALAGQGMLTRAEDTEKGNVDAAYIDEVGALEMPVFSAGLMSNNIGVTFIAFAGGLLAGVGTLAILLINGVSIGAVLGAYANEGVLGVILAFVFPHGVVELTAICVAAGAGFVLGSALLMPGRRTRAEAVRERGATALSLLAGSALMLVVAGLIEGFYSPSTLPAWAKFTFGGTTFVLLAAYFGLAGRGRSPAAGGVPRTGPRRRPDYTAR